MSPQRAHVQQAPDAVGVTSVQNLLREAGVRMHEPLAVMPLLIQDTHQVDDHIDASGQSRQRCGIVDVGSDETNGR